MDPRRACAPFAALLACITAACGASQGDPTDGRMDARGDGPPVVLPRHHADANTGHDGGHDARIDATVGADGASDAGEGTDEGGAGPDAGFDAPYPAFTIEAPQVIANGGPVLSNPLFVPVVFPGETLTASIQTFMSSLGGSQYWATVGAEYGVGPATSTDVVVEGVAPPTSLTDTQIQAWLANAIATDPRFLALGAPDAGVQPGNPDASPPPDVAYVLFYPAGVSIDAAGLGMSCTAFGGYHYDFTLPNGATVVYAVIPRCASFNQLSGIDFVTTATSHELIESATDPDITTHPGFVGTDVDHFLWELVLGNGEVADMCSFLPYANVHPNEPGLGAFLVQRIWSNKAAAAGNDPCVPALNETAYFNSVPVTPEIPFVDQGQTYQTLGTQIPVGQTATVTLDLFSNASTDGPWTVQLLDYGAAYNNPTILDLEIVGASTGVNGQTIQVQVTPLMAGPSTFFGLSPYFIYSEQGGVANFWVGAVSN